MFANLLCNAVKYTRNCPTPRIEVSALVRNRELVVTVHDNGVGFDPQDAQRLFRLFTRGQAPADCEGTGIGLAIVQRVVERHGGSVWAEGRPGAGAAFHFSLPIAAEQARAA